jgi:hypothetical protein
MCIMKASLIAICYSPLERFARRLFLVVVSPVFPA